MSRVARANLGLTQGELAGLMGVHPLTVSKWERGVAAPTAYQRALLDAFSLAADRLPGVGPAAVQAAAGRGVPRGLLLLLAGAYGSGAVMRAVVDEVRP